MDFFADSERSPNSPPGVGGLVEVGPGTRSNGEVLLDPPPSDDGTLTVLLSVRLDVETLCRLIWAALVAS